MATSEEINEDWLKTRSWDLGSFEGLLLHLGVLHAPVAVQRQALIRFSALPAWEAAPATVRAAANKVINARV